jgi:small GTP-binding protein
MGDESYLLKQIETKYKIKLARYDFPLIDTPSGYAVDANGDVLGLNFHFAAIKDFSFLKEFSKLQVLYLEGNQIEDISFLEKLEEITKIDLSNNSISDLTPLRNLRRINHLILSNNKISDISTLGDLPGLSILDLHKNYIEDISPLKTLSNLNQLNLSGNKIDDISHLNDYQSFREVNLKNNQIKTIPGELIDRGYAFEWRHCCGIGILLEGNPLERPPIEICTQGDAAVRNYFAALRLEEEVKLNEVKLIFVGNGKVGKTTLMNTLIDPDYKFREEGEIVTEGINVRKWEFDNSIDADITQNIKVNIWDFGGQEILRSTHQFFLTKRSIYLFIWEPRGDSQHSFEYWLNIIKLLGKESPVIVVMNKLDEGLENPDENGYRDQFNTIEDFLQVSCKTREGIDELRERIQDIIIHIPHLHDGLPRVWLNIRNNLEKMEQNYISVDEYFNICASNRLNEEKAKFLSGYLHDIGVILHFQDDYLLGNIVILKPGWVTEAFYKLIRTHFVIQQNGSFTLGDLRKIWPLTSYPVEMHKELVRLMERFELCLNFVGTDEYLIPQLLSPDSSKLEYLENYRKQDHLSLEYHYEFMPEGIISRFITRVYVFGLTILLQFWKNGVELKSLEAEAIVINIPLNKKIKIFVVGETKSELMTIIRRQIENIHQSLQLEKNKHYFEKIPCPCAKCTNSNEPYLVRTDVLERFGKGKTALPCQNSTDIIPVDKLLCLYNIRKRMDLSREELFGLIIETAAQLQGLSKSIRPDENSRNDIFAMLLCTKGLIANDQSRWGRSGTRLNIGHLDIKIEERPGVLKSIIEAFILRNLEKKIIDDHLIRLIECYNVNGLPENYIIVYVEADKFYVLWENYLNHISTEVPGYPCQIERISDVNYNTIKVAKATYVVNEQETFIYHIFIKI